MFLDPMPTPTPRLVREFISTARDTIRRAAEKIAPPEIDQTRILSDEELEELRRQEESRKAAQDLAAASQSPEELLERLRAGSAKSSKILLPPRPASPGTPLAS